MVSITIIAYVFSQKQANISEACEAFKATTRVMEDVVSSNIVSAQRMCKSRAKYINENHMTIEEAITYVRQSQTSEVTGQIIRLDTMEGLSTDIDETTLEPCHVSYFNQNIIDTKNMNNDSNLDVSMTKSYTNPVDGNLVISFYNQIELVDDEGNNVDAVLMRVVPVAVLQTQWVFPSYYSGAELMLMAEDGEYLLRPDTFVSYNFFDVMNTYNDKKTDIDKLKVKIENNREGSFIRNNSYDTQMYFTYIHLSASDDMIMVGCVPLSSLRTPKTDWTIPIIIIISLALIVIIDFAYVKMARRNKDEAEKTMREQLSVIDVLSREFQTLWIIDSKTRKCRLYRGIEESIRIFEKKDVLTESDYDVFMNKYIDNFVLEDEREEVKNIVLQGDFFSEIPNDGSIYSLNYTRNMEGNINYFQMCFARTFNQSGHIMIILGFRNIDKIIRKEI